MSKDHWISGTLRFYWATREQGCVDCEDSVYLVRAPDFDEAMRRFIEIGRKREKAYENMEGNQVRERFVGVMTIDMLRSENLDGVEVSCFGPANVDLSKLTFDVSLDPASHEPGQTGVW